MYHNSTDITVFFKHLKILFQGHHSKCSVANGSFISLCGVMEREREREREREGERGLTVAWLQILKMEDTLV